MSAQRLIKNMYVILIYDAGHQNIRACSSCKKLQRALDTILACVTADAPLIYLHCTTSCIIIAILAVAHHPDMYLVRFHG